MVDFDPNLALRVQLRTASELAHGLIASAGTLQILGDAATQFPSLFCKLIVPKVEVLKALNQSSKSSSVGISKPKSRWDLLFPN